MLFNAYIEREGGQIIPLAESAVIKDDWCRLIAEHLGAHSLLFMDDETVLYRWDEINGKTHPKPISITNGTAG